MGAPGYVLDHGRIVVLGYRSAQQRKAGTTKTILGDCQLIAGLWDRNGIRTALRSDQPIF